MINRLIALLVVVFLFGSQAAVGGVVPDPPDQPFAVATGKPVSRALFQSLMQETSAWLGDTKLQNQLKEHGFVPNSTPLVVDWNAVDKSVRNEMATSLFELKKLKEEKHQATTLALLLKNFRSKYYGLTSRLLRQQGQQAPHPTPTTHKTPPPPSLAAAAEPGVALTPTDDETASSKDSRGPTTQPKTHTRVKTKTTTVVNRSRTKQWSAVWNVRSQTEEIQKEIIIGNHHYHPLPFPNFPSLKLALTSHEQFELELLLQAVFRRLEVHWAELPLAAGRVRRQRLFHTYFAAVELQLRHRSWNHSQLKAIKQELIALREHDEKGRVNIITKAVDRLVKNHTRSLRPIPGSLAYLKRAADQPILVYRSDGRWIDTDPPTQAVPFRPGACAPSAPTLAAAGSVLRAASVLTIRLRRISSFWQAPRRSLPSFPYLALSRAGPLVRAAIGGSLLFQNPATAGFFRL